MLNLDIGVYKYCKYTLLPSKSKTNTHINTHMYMTKETINTYED